MFFNFNMRKVEFSNVTKGKFRGIFGFLYIDTLTKTEKSKRNFTASKYLEFVNSILSSETIIRINRTSTLNIC
jgi:hypothetical protein